MAKKVGDDTAEDDKIRMRDGGDEGAPADHNMSAARFLTAVRDISNHRAAVEAANTKLKQRRKHWKSLGVALGSLDKILKMADWSRGEVRDEFATLRQYAEWMNLPYMGQPDMYKGWDDEQVQKAEWRAMGRTASLAGKGATVPEECPPEFQQDWLGGFNDIEEEEWSAAEPAGGVQ